MRVRNFAGIALATLLALLLQTASSQAVALPPGVVQQTILSGNLDNPVLLFELPDGRMVVAQKNGRFFRFDPNAQPASIASYLQITDIEVGGERGVNGVALDPDFATNGYIYVFYTKKSNNRNRISRFRHMGNYADLSSEFVVWESPQNWSDCCHYGGGLVFGPDGKLYLSLGEEFDGPQAQDLTRPGGKIIRINKDGTIPADNPFVDGAGGNLDEIWAYGLRNPFRAHWDFVANRYYLGEVGGNVQETAREDLHIGRVGANYGWPYCEGNCNNPAWDAPVYDYGHTGATPNGGAIVAGFTYRGSQFPSSYVGKFFFADYAQGWIKYLTFNPDGSFASETEFATGTGAPVFLMQSQNGSIYYVNILGSVGRFTYNAGNQAPTVTSATGTPITGNAPLTVNFTATATDPESNPISYRWIFGDGTEVNGQSVSHTYTQNGVYTAYVQVSDGSNSSLSDPIPIAVGNPPVVTINTPIDGALFRAGNQVAFSGTASDPDETIAAANYRWDILFLHNAHTHPTLEGHVGQTGTLSINTSGHDYHDSTAYQLTLTVTDSDGLTGSDTVTVYPDKVDLNLSTVPAGLPVFLDGVQLATPIAYDTVISFQHVVSVPASTCVSGTAYNFSHWSDGGAQTHQVTIPTQDTSLVAHFSAGGSCDSLPTGGLVMRLESDSGVVTSGGLVTAWNDLSGSGVSLNASAGDPSLVPNALNGRAAVDFDGTGDRLSGTALAALPAGNTDREMFMVVNYRGVGYGGASYGTAADNQVFGLGVNPAGNLMVQGWGVSNDFTTTTRGTGNGWMIQSVSLSSNVMSHYQNGNMLASVNHAYNTVKSQFALGVEIDGNPNVNMQVAALLVYNRALSAAERNAVVDFLNDKYFTAGGNIAPVANNDSAAVVNGGSVTVSVLANDQDSDGTLNPASVVITQAPANGVATVNANGTITYLHSGTGTTDSFRYTVTDDGGLVSNVATVSVSVTAGATLPTTGLVLRLEADAGVQTSGTLVTSWQDQSGSGNHLTYAGDPALLASGSPNGRPVIDFDGSGDKLQRVGGLNGLPTGAADRTVIMLANYRGAGYGGFAYGQVALNKVFGALVDPQGRLMVQAWGATYDAVSSTAGTGAGWLVQTVSLQGNQLSHFKDGTLIGSRTQTYATGNSQIVLGAEIDSNPYVDMQVGAVLVYNRALSAQERADADAYLRNKYLVTSTNQPPVAIADSASTTNGSSVAINVVANDSDPEGELNAASVAIVTPPASGNAVIGSGGVITYTHSGAATTSDSFTYRVADAQGALSNTATVTLSISSEPPPLSPQDCLEQNPGNPGACMVEMFDGETLGDTYPWFSTSGASDPTQIFKVENGLLHVSGNGIGALISNQRYRDFTMVLEFKWGPGTYGPRAGKAKDAGLFVHSNGVEGGFDDIWMPGLQIQLGDGIMGDFILMEGEDASGTVVPMAYTATTDQVTCTYNNWNCRGGYRWKANGTSRLFDQPLGHVHWTNWDPDWQDVIGFRGDNDVDSPDGEWNQAVIVADGDQVTVYINGVKVNEATQVSPSSGKVQLEVEWAEFFVRRWELWPLDGAPTPLRPLSITSNELPAATPGVPYSYTLQTIGGSGSRTFAVTSGQLPAGLALNSGTGVISGTASVAGSYQFTITAVDDTGYPDEQVVTLTVNSATGALPTSGLVLRLEGDSGFESSNGIVTLWRDQSASQNHLSGVGDPRIATNSPSGLPVLDLDGSGARLERIGGSTALPTGAANRTVIMLANYRGVGYGGFAYGQAANNQTFGAIVDPQGRLLAQAWGTTYDAATTTAGTGAGWLMQSLVLQNNQMSHYRNTQLIGSRTQTYATASNRIVLGAEIDNAPNVNMQVAAVLVYNRALSTQELADVYSYLNTKYLSASSNQPPVATADAASVVSGGTVAINVLSNDSDPEGALNASSVQVVTAPVYGVATVNTATGAISYTHGGASTSDSFTYRVADAQGLHSQPATVTVTATAPDATVTITAPQQGGVIVGNSVTVNYTLSGTGYNHLHLSLDGDGHNTIMDMNGVFTFTGVTPGMHTIEAELVDANHNPIDAPNASDTVSFEVVGDTGGVPATGLVLRLEADQGVGVSGTTVTGWSDQSGRGNHLTAAGNPQLLPGVLNGQSVIDFDGNGDKLSRTTALTGLPAGNGNRTVIMLANYRSNGYGGFGYGAIANNQVFGLGVTPAGRLMVQGWGTSNDFTSTQVGNGAGWMVQSAILNNSQLSHYLGATLIDSRSHAYGTVLNQLVLGAEIDSSPYLSMQVAALLIYDRALSADEYTQVLAYLQQKYLQEGGSNVAPVANNDSASVAQGASVSIDVLANDGDSDGTIDPSSVQVTQNPAAATLVVDPATGAVLYQHNGSAGTSDSFRYRVQDEAGANSNEATVAMTIIAGNQPPSAAADSALVTLQGSVTIDVAANDSDPEGSLNPASVTVVTQPTRGVVTNNGNGTLTYQLTATTAGTDTFTYTIRDVEGNSSAAATVTVEAVATVPSNGLVMWLESGAGIVANGGVLSSWRDQSPAGNHLTGIGSPLWLPSVANGKPVVDLNGTSATLQRTALTSFPLAAANRSIYLVTNYRSNGFGGFGYGAVSCNGMFGMGVSNIGKLTVQSWCTDFKSSYQGTGYGMAVESLILSGNVFNHYRDGTTIDRRTHTFSTAAGPLVIGAELDGAPLVSMQVAAVLVFNRALTTSEHWAVVSYLTQKYLVQ